MEYIYLIREREFINTNKQIYKLGYTGQDPNKRMCAYPKGSELLICMKTNTPGRNVELVLIRIFMEKFVQIPDVGREYFSGDVSDMIRIIFNTCSATSPDLDVRRRITSAHIMRVKSDRVFTYIQSRVKNVKEKHIRELLNSDFFSARITKLQSRIHVLSDSGCTGSALYRLLAAIESEKYSLVAVHNNLLACTSEESLYDLVYNCILLLCADFMHSGIGCVFQYDSGGRVCGLYVLPDAKTLHTWVSGM